MLANQSALEFHLHGLALRSLRCDVVNLPIGELPVATEERTEGTKLLRLKGNDLFCTIFLHLLRFFQRTHGAH